MSYGENIQDVKSTALHSLTSKNLRVEFQVFDTASEENEWNDGEKIMAVALRFYRDGRQVRENTESLEGAREYYKGLLVKGWRK